jgi:hypothetical protein
MKAADAIVEPMLSHPKKASALRSDRRANATAATA